MLMYFYHKLIIKICRSGKLHGIVIKFALKSTTPIQLLIKGMIQCGWRGIEKDIFNPNDYEIDRNDPIPESNDDDNNVIL